MKRSFGAAFLVLLWATLCQGQSTSVTLQVTDLDVQTWNNGTWSVQLTSPPGVPCCNYNILGTNTPVPNQQQSGALSGTGGASLTVTPNTSIAPARTQWTFQVCPQASPSPCFQQSFTITGAAQTVTINPPAIRINLQNPVVKVTAYQDIEAVNGSFGSEYFNLTSSAVRVCISVALNVCTYAALGGGGGTPGGSNTQIQYNNAGAFGGDSNLTWNSASKIFTLGLSPISLISPDPTGFVNQILSIPDTGINLTGDASFDGNINIHNVFADGISMYVHSDTGFRGPTLNLYKSGGTQASPTVAAAVLGYVNFGGWDGSAYANFATMTAQPAQIITTTHHGTDMIISTTPINSTTSANVFWIKNDGAIAFGANGDAGFSRLSAGNLALGNGTQGDFSGLLKLTTLNTGAIATISNCSAVGTAASPSIVSCASATAGSFSCATNASTGTCVINTTAVTANSEIFVTQRSDTTTGTRLGVTCNVTLSTVITEITAVTAGTSFTINLGTIAANPECFSYFIVN